MAKHSIKHSAFSIKLSQQESAFFEKLAKTYLAYFGNLKPSRSQVIEMQSLLSFTYVKQQVQIDGRLTAKEKECLYLAARGKKTKEIAHFLNISVRKVERYRESIFKKFDCRHIAEAVALGVRYGEININ